MMKWGQALSRTSVAWRTQALAAQRERWLRITGRCRSPGLIDGVPCQRSAPQWRWDA